MATCFADDLVRPPPALSTQFVHGQQVPPAHDAPSAQPPSDNPPANAWVYKSSSDSPLSPSEKPRTANPDGRLFTLNTSRPPRALENQLAFFLRQHPEYAPHVEHIEKR